MGKKKIPKRSPFLFANYIERDSTAGKKRGSARKPLEPKASKRGVLIFVFTVHPQKKKKNVTQSSRAPSPVKRRKNQRHLQQKKNYNFLFM